MLAHVFELAEEQAQALLSIAIEKEAVSMLVVKTVFERGIRNGRIPWGLVMRRPL
jgi:hypothetical protein